MRKGEATVTATNPPEILANTLIACGLIALLMSGVGCATGTQQDRDSVGNHITTRDLSQPDVSGDDLALAHSDPLFEDPFEEEDGGEVYDPWESFNSTMFSFNQRADRYLFKPIAKGYDWIMPDPIERGLSNAFHNLGFAPRLLNNLLQGKMKESGIETSRFLLNSTLGLAGLFDVAGSWFDLEPSEEDTGQTLAVYGVGTGPYLVLPLMPPLTVRDSVGFMTNFVLNPLFYVAPSTALVGMTAGRTVNERSQKLDAFEEFEAATLDLYSATRDIYFKRRAQAVLN